MKKINIFIPALLVCVIFFDCQKKITDPDIISDTQLSSELSTDDVAIQNLIKMGFRQDMIEDRGEYIIVEGDIGFSREQLIKMPLSKITQYRYPYLVSMSKVSNIGVKIDNSISYWSTVIEEALAMWNTPISELHFNIVTDSPDITINSDQASGIPSDYQNLRQDSIMVVGAQASFPDENGNPGWIISVNMDIYQHNTNDKRRTTIAHEIGHCIGFRHTNYWAVDPDQYDYLAIYIPETPLSWDAQSIMNGGILGDVMPLGGNDKVALHTLYPSQSSFYSGPKAERVYWNYSQHSGNIQVQLPNFTETDIESEGSGMATTKFYFADVNGDGKDDRIYWNYSQHSGDLQIRLATSGGYFSSSTIYQAGSGMSSTRFYFADVNGDGKDDRIYWNYSQHSGDLQIRLATGSGYFSSSTIYQAGSGMSSTKFYFPDVNGDGKDDRIYWNYSQHSGDLQIRLATGSGYFSSSTIYQAGSGMSSTKFYFPDVNGDGKDDRIYWNYSQHSGDLQIRLATGSGYFSSSTIYEIGSGISNAQFFFADVNGDGDVDRIKWSYTYQSGASIVQFGNGNGYFSNDNLYIAGSGMSSTTLHFGNVD